MALLRSGTMLFTYAVCSMSEILSLLSYIHSVINFSACWIYTCDEHYFVVFWTTFHNGLINLFYVVCAVYGTVVNVGNDKAFFDSGFFEFTVFKPCYLYTV